MDEHFEGGQGGAPGCVDHGRAERIPPPALDPCALSVERVGGVPGLDDAPGSDVHEGLGKDAVLEATHQVFNLSCANLGVGEVDGHVPTESGLSSREPLDGGISVAFKERQCLAKEPRGAKETVGFVGKEPPLAFATRHRATRHVDERDEPLERQVRVALEPFERAIRQALSNESQHARRIRCVETKQGHVRVRSENASAQRRLETIEILGR